MIRVGGPSAASDPKVAIVASSKKLRRFTAIDGDGARMLHGRLRRAPGSPAPWKHVYTADISRLTAPGSYRVRAGGMTSRSWRVSKSARRKLVRRLLAIFDANSDGDEPSTVFGPAHLNDAQTKGGEHVDLVGGWRDAGDNLKFSRTMALAVTYLELAARLDPEDGTQLRDTAEVGIRWLLKAHPAPGVFYALVGDDRDHSTDWRNPENDDADDRMGVGVRITYPTVSSDETGIVAGALALAAVTRPGGRQTELIAAAQDWYAQAKATNAIVPIQDPNVSEYYGDDDFADDLAFAATGLYRATGDESYLNEADTFLRSGSDDQFYSGVTAGTVGPIVAAELCGGLGAPAVLNESARQAGCDGLAKVVDAAGERMRENAFGSPGIFTFGWVEDNAGAGALAAAAKRAGIAPGGDKIAAAARDYLRGRNQWGASFIVGRGRSEARNPHHPAFLEGNAARLLDGAVVGGVTTPDQMGEFDLELGPGPYRRFNSNELVYEDRRSNFETSEVALGYSGAALLLAASLGG